MSLNDFNFCAKIIEKDNCINYSAIGTWESSFKFILENTKDIDYKEASIIEYFEYPYHPRIEKIILSMRVIK